MAHAETKIGRDALRLKPDLLAKHGIPMRLPGPINITLEARRGIVPAQMYKSVLREIRWRPMAALVETTTCCVRPRSYRNNQQRSDFVSGPLSPVGGSRHGTRLSLRY
jgi:hypothetical protein